MTWPSRPNRNCYLTILATRTSRMRSIPPMTTILAQSLCAIYSCRRTCVKANWKASTIWALTRSIWARQTSRSGGPKLLAVSGLWGLPRTFVWHAASITTQSDERIIMTPVIASSAIAAYTFMTEGITSLVRR